MNILGNTLDTELLDDYNLVIQETKDIVNQYGDIDYLSRFNYEEYGINDSRIVTRLIGLEKVIHGAKEKILKSTADYLKALKEANELLSKNGTFGEWCNSIGLTKDQVSLFYKKDQFANTYKLEYEEVERLPQAVIRECTKKKQEFTEDEVLEIMTAEKPYVKLKELKSAKKIDFSLAIEKSNELNFLNKEIEKLEKKLIELKNKRDNLSKEISI